MRRTTLIATLATAALLTGGGAWWLTQPSYDDKVNACGAALKDRPENVKEKPGACDGVKEDAYDAMLMSHVIDELGWTDDDGNFDENKMIEDSLDQ
ncbi:hypothetical protein ABZ819_11370 [Streptomyces venezuelae]|uniref:hypothetical protein n=1 Tax=Streptomyces venezuelae TaxID=54571 RepID=UPI00343063B8